MKIRFCPGICWNTWAVQIVACAPVRTVARKIALSPSGLSSVAGVRA